MKKKAAVYDPYLDTIGGGEVYTCNFIYCLLEQGFDVDVFWNDKEIIKKINEYLGIDIYQAKINKKGYNLFEKSGNWISKINLSQNYNLFFFLSDGSIPLLFSKLNLLHFQTPFTNVDGKSLTNRIKMKKIDKVIVNSGFTKKFVDQEFAVESEVIFPPINVSPPKKNKKNTILSVGRFTKTLHDKRQDILIEAFKKMMDEGLEGWNLRLIGSVKAEGKELVDKLRQKCQGYPIDIMVDIRHQDLELEYSQAKIFWHAAGYGVDQEKHPESVEHFGIATCEAMAAAAVPVVIDKGGQPEIVKNGENGYLWNSIDSLKNLTHRLIKSPEELEKLAVQAKKSSLRFSKKRFYKNVVDVILSNYS